MVEGCVTYHARTRNFLCSPVVIDYPDKRISRIALETFNGNLALKIQVWFVGDYGEEDARAFTDDIAVWTLNQLARHANVHFYDPVFMGYSKVTINPDGTQTIEETATAVLRLGYSADFDIVDSQEQAKKIKAELERGKQPHDDDFSRYRDALISSDDVSQFMHLYRILMSYHADKMKPTDDYIHCMLPHLEYKQTGKESKGNREWETVFTRLRNQVGHNRGIAAASTQDEMRSYLWQLQKLVKQCIENPPSTS